LIFIQVHLLVVGAKATGPEAIASGGKNRRSEALAGGGGAAVAEELINIINQFDRKML
jgi:hypothetical protein